MEHIPVRLQNRARHSQLLRDARKAPLASISRSSRGPVSGVLCCVICKLCRDICLLDRLPGKEIKGYIVTTKYMYTGLKFVHGVYVLLLPIPWRAALFWVFLVVTLLFVLQREGGIHAAEDLVLLG